MSDYRDKTAQVMAKIMEVNVNDINDETSPDNLDEWDSLSQVQLVLQLEQEFDISISPEEGIEHLTDFKNILKFIDSKIR